MVKDLWALRLQLLKRKIDADLDDEILFVNSQPETDQNHDEDGVREYKVRGKDMPTLIETLGLCYLAFVLLRLPVSLGDLQRYSPPTPPKDP